MADPLSLLTRRRETQRSGARPDERETQRSGARPGDRWEGLPDDGARVALVVEGGGSRATYSAGMAAALEDQGFGECFDAVYGVSAGSLNAAWFTAGMARAAMAPWVDRSVMRGTIDPRRLLRGGPVVDLAHLVEHVYVHEFPMPFDRVLAGPFHPMATDAATGASTDLRPLLTGPEDVPRALRASSTLPVLAGPPQTLHGRRFVDGGLAEPVAVHTALAAGITHLVVLRTHAAEHVPAEPPGVVDAIVRRWLRRHAPGVLDPWRRRVAEAARTEAVLDGLGERVVQVRPPADAPAVSRTSTDLGLLGEALQVGYAEVGDTVGDDLSTPPAR
ncbi:patatin-like phospholipase family protein [Actinomycetospora sp. CA-084318]|uniref:patatin-like phospholipase family protein n=1 Tax=Actinomycetospora sp. CA-084318 TaxID=3239892 RepID=UPI003D997D34